MIGDDYQKTVEELKEKIRKEEITVLGKEALENKTNVGFSCYFCRKHIDGKVNVLVNPSKDCKSMPAYPVHDRCYEEAKSVNF